MTFSNILGIETCAVIECASIRREVVFNATLEKLASETCNTWNDHQHMEFIRFWYPVDNVRKNAHCVVPTFVAFGKAQTPSDFVSIISQDNGVENLHQLNSYRRLSVYEVVSQAP